MPRILESMQVHALVKKERDTAAEGALSPSPQAESRHVVPTTFSTAQWSSQ